MPHLFPMPNIRQIRQCDYREVVTDLHLKINYHHECPFCIDLPIRRDGRTNGGRTDWLWGGKESERVREKEFKGDAIVGVESNDDDKRANDLACRHNWAHTPQPRRMNEIKMTTIG